MLHTHYPLLDSSCVFLWSLLENAVYWEKKGKKNLKHNITEIGDLILSTYCIYTEMECAIKFLMKWISVWDNMNFYVDLMERLRTMAEKCIDCYYLTRGTFS